MITKKNIILFTSIDQNEKLGDHTSLQHLMAGVFRKAMKMTPI